MSRIGQHVLEQQQGQQESFEPDPLYDDWQETQKNDPGYEEFLKKVDNLPF